MKLKRLLEMIRGDINGAEDWPVLFSSFKQNPAGELEEVDNVRQAITSVQVEDGAEEILLITDSDGLPLSLARLEEELTRLTPSLSEFTVDCCETPVVMDNGWNLHIDFPVVGAGREEKDRCYLIVYAFRSSD